MSRATRDVILTVIAYVAIWAALALYIAALYRAGIRP